MRKLLYASLLIVFACGVVQLPEQTPTAYTMPTPHAVPVPQSCLYTVTAVVLHVRTCPGTYCGLVKDHEYLYFGDEVIVTKHENSWDRVWIGGQVGYVNSQYLKGCEE